jgi:methylated-DNA-protein-cysteine methyltransferase-like protein
MGMAKNSNNQGITKASSRRHKQTEGDGALNQASLSKTERIWQVIASIPHGQVASYGQVAKLAGLPGYARFVGTTLGKLPADTRLPWHRVVNSALGIAPRNSLRMSEQKRRLREEGIIFSGDKVTKAFHWQP